MGYCANCGNELKDGTQFCPKCGNPSNSVTSQRQEETKLLSTPSKQKKKLFGIIIAAIIIPVLYVGGKTFGGDYSLEGLAKAVVNYRTIGDFHEGMALVKKGNEQGFIDKTGKEVIPCIYNQEIGRAHV